VRSAPLVTYLRSQSSQFAAYVTVSKTAGVGIPEDSGIRG
jgi:hypothetical protein